MYVGRHEDQQKVRELTSEQSRTVEDNLKRFNTATESHVLQRSVQEPEISAKKPVAPIVSYHTAKQRRRRLTELGVSGLTKVEPANNMDPLSNTEAFAKRRRVSDVGGWRGGAKCENSLALYK